MLVTSHLHPERPTPSLNMAGLTSAAGLVGFLSEPDPDLQVFALKRLNDEVDLLWTEIASSVWRMCVSPRH